MSDLSESFNQFPSEYNQYRTGYQKAVIDYIIGLAPLNKDSNICEIGCGTGQATQSIVERGLSVVCIELGEALIDYAKQNLFSFPVKFQNEKFEDADLPANRFDLVYAAQSFHWIDSKVAYQKVSRILKNGGAFAAFWKNTIPSNTRLNKIIQDICKEFIPNFKPQTVESYEKKIANTLNEIVGSELFERCELRRYKEPHGVANCDEYVGQLGTWSSVLMLPAPVKTNFLNKIRLAINKSGGDIAKDHNETVLICGIKKQV